jgi:tetratricopeptide (TPR) repeat protein
MLGAAAAERSYRAALTRWPSDELVLFAAAGERYAAGDLPEATALYRRLLAAAPQNAAARNNLANVLADRGCHDEALAEARIALADVAAADELGAAVRDTVAELEHTAAQARAPAARCE